MYIINMSSVGGEGKGTNSLTGEREREREREWDEVRVDCNGLKWFGHMKILRKEILLERVY